MREVITSVEKATGRAVPVREVGRRAGDPPVLVADARQAGERLGWKPRYPELDTIVAHAVRWHGRPNASHAEATYRATQAGREAVAAAPHRQEVPRLIGIALELGAQLRDEVVDGPRLALLEAPHLAQQLLARVDAAAVAAEEAEQLELEVRELDRAAGAAHGPLREIDGDVPEPQDLVGLRRRRSRCQRAARTRAGSLRRARRSTAATRARSSASANGLVM